MENKVKGVINIGLSSLFFLYYSLWVIGLPFVDEEYAAVIHKFFPPVEYALGIPCVVFGIIFMILLVKAYMLVCYDRKNKAV